MRGADWQPRPALAVTTSEGQYDTIASRFELSGPSRYHRERDPTATTAAIAVEPAVTGVLVERIAGCDRKTLRTVDTSLTVRLEEPTRGTIDGHPQLFPVGEYTVTALPRRYFRVAGSVICRPVRTDVQILRYSSTRESSRWRRWRVVSTSGGYGSPSFRWSRSAPPGVCGRRSRDTGRTLAIPALLERSAGMTVRV